MGITDTLNNSGFKAEESKAGEQMLYEGVYKAILMETREMEDKGYGTSLWAQFQATECLGGNEYGVGKKFSDFYSTDDKNIGSKSKGLAKFLNGLFSVGIEVDQTSDEALMNSLQELYGSAEVYISVYKKQKMEKDGENWVPIKGEFKQAFTFLTPKNAEKEAKKYGSEKASSTPF